jgi:NADP-dependent 3-hydroxy acid dehydrogenase YdfG
MVGINEQNAVSAGSLLSGHVALVTGASRGIGKAIASKLAQLGAAVSICARNAEALEQAAADLSATGAKIRYQAVDVTDARQVKTLVEVTEKELGPVTVLVNNAGIGSPGFGPIHEKSEDDWQRVLDTNLKSVFLVSKAVVSSMIARRRGEIIHISSLAGKNTFAGGGIYCASKWGLQGLAGCMAEDLRGFGIRVTVVCPGSVATEFSGRTLKDPSKVLTPEDVAYAVSMIVLQGPQSFISEVQLRPVAKP